MNLEDYFDMLRKMANPHNPDPGEITNGKKTTDDNDSDEPTVARTI